MKRLSKIFLFICALFLLSGCMKYNVSMGINEDKSMDLQIILAIDEESLKEMMKSMNGNDYDEESMSSLIDMSEEKEILRERGYEAEEYSEDNYNGIIANLKIKNIDDVSVEEDLQVILSNILNEDFDDSKFFKVERDSDKNIYTANFVYKADNSDDMDDIPGLELKYTVRLPYKVISDNADSKRNNELTWNINLDKDTNINYSFEVTDELEDDEVVSSNSDDENSFIVFISDKALIIGLAALVVVIIIVIVIIVVSRNKKKRNNKKSNNTQTTINQESKVDETETITDNTSLITEDMVIDTTNSEILNNEDIHIEVNNETLVDENVQVDEVTNTETLNNQDTDVVNNEIDEDVNDEQVVTNSESEILDTQEDNNEQKKCKLCGSEIEDGQKFCMNCGSKLD